ETTTSVARIGASLRCSRATGSSPVCLCEIVAGSGPVGNQRVVSRGREQPQALGQRQLAEEGSIHLNAVVDLRIGGYRTRRTGRDYARTMVAYRYRNGCRHFMDPSGRFDFWRMLIHTRAITPPRVALKLWSQVAKQAWVGWWALGVIAALSVAAALRLGGSDLPSQSAANSPPSPIVASPSPAKPHLRW